MSAEAKDLIAGLLVKVRLCDLGHVVCPYVGCGHNREVQKVVTFSWLLPVSRIRIRSNLGLYLCRIQKDPGRDPTFLTKLRKNLCIIILINYK